MNIQMSGNYFYIGTSNHVHHSVFGNYRPLENISIWDFRTLTFCEKISPPKVCSFHVNGNHLLVKSYKGTENSLTQWDVRNLGDGPFASIEYHSLEDFCSDWQSIYIADSEHGLGKIHFG